MKIRSKLIVLYSLLFILSMIISIWMYQRINRQIILEEITNSSEETVHAVGQNIEKSLEWISVYSKVILSNQDTQNMLNAATESERLESSRNFYRFINDITINFDEIAGIYVVDNNGEMYFKDKTDGYLISRKLEIEKSIMQQDEWLKSVQVAEGKAVFQVKRGVLAYDEREELYFTCARTINDLNNQKPIGIIIVIFKCSMIEQAFEGLDAGASRHYSLYDEKGTAIFEAGGIDDDKPDAGAVVYNGQTDIQLADWSFEYIVHQSAYAAETKRISIVVLSVIILNGIVLSFGAGVIASRFTSPVSTLTEAMQNIDFKEIQELNIKTSIPEFNVLKDGYNRMLRKIKQLLDNIIVEQKMKRKAELEALQAQIKPHFLYNTIDSISALALLKDYEKIHSLSTSLGQFYRSSLSGGNEIISIGDEIELVENYLMIQQIRYPNKFRFKYDIEEEVIDLPILKLILQPFVENALYHGIKPKMGTGIIYIRCYLEGDDIMLEIEDDGVGMKSPEKQLEKNGNRSFGIRGTIERLRLFAGVQDVIKVESEIGKGTKITLKIPKKRSAAYGEV